MTNEEWSLFFQAIGAIAAVVAAGTFVAALLQLKHLREQLSDTRKWNKLSAFYFHDNIRKPDIREIRKKLNLSFIKLIDRKSPLTHEEVIRLMSEEESETRQNLNVFLNELEVFCLAANIGIIDDEVAKRFYDYIIVRHYVELKPFIDRVRADNNDDEIFIEIERTVQRWRPGSEEKITY